MSKPAPQWAVMLGVRRVIKGVFPMLDNETFRFALGFLAGTLPLLLIFLPKVAVILAPALLVALLVVGYLHAKQERNSQ